ncbi:MAG: GNAT family N-acetyltransferase [Myxococcota bacterium]|jgi:GNAT superfamily N-acetyltransferase
MELQWVTDGSPARWDDDKERVIRAPKAAVFPSLASVAPGSALAGDWWRVTDGGRTVGYAWMDVTWGDAEVLLAVDPSTQRHGVGTFALDRLDREAGRRGVRYLYNVVPAAHPEPAALASWLERRGFVSADHTDAAEPAGRGQLLRRQVRAR